MQVSTKRFGDIEVPDDRVLSFPDGLPGFPTSHHFTLIDVRDSGVFYWLQSLDHPELAFLTAVPWAFFPDYEPELPDSDQDALGLSSAADAMVLVILTVQRDESRITGNLLGPVVVNQASRIGRQVVLADGDHPVQALLPAA